MSFIPDQALIQYFETAGTNEDLNITKFDTVTEKIKQKSFANEQNSIENIDNNEYEERIASSTEIN